MNNIPVNPWASPAPGKIDPYALLKQWDDAAQTLSAAKELEMTLRKQVTETFFPIPKKGTQRHPLANNYALKLVYGLAYSLGNNTDKIDAMQEAMDALGPAGKLYANRLVKWTAEPSVSEYNKLSEEATNGDKVAIAIKKLIDELLTTKPKAPTLEIEAPAT